MNKVQVIFEIDKDAQGRTTLKQIESGITRLGRTSKQAGSEIDASLSFFKGAILVEFFRQGVGAAFEFAKSAVAAFNEAQAAAIGLQTVAKGAGVDPQAALDAVKNLALVKNGLLTVAEASTALKNNLRTGFSLEQSIDLIKKFGDAAAFNKQSAISFGDAVVRTSEGIRQNLSTLADAGGITTNLSVILGRAGLTFEDLTDKVNGQANATKFYNELLKETAVFSGDAEKKANTFAGQTDALAAKQKVLMQTIGEIITSSPELQSGLQSVGDTLGYITSQLKDSDSELHKFVSNSAAEFGVLIELAAKFARGINAIAGAINFLNPIGDALNPGSPVSKDEAKNRADTKKTFNDLAKAYKDAQAKLKTDLAQAPIFDAGALKKKEQEDKKAFAEMKKDSDDYFKKQATDQKLLDDLAKQSADALREMGNATAELNAKLSINPIGAAFDAASSKQEQFLIKLKNVPEKMKAAFVQAAQEVNRLELFKGTFGQGQGLGGLAGEIAKLQSGFGGSELRDKKLEESLAFEERKLELIKLGANVRGASTRVELEKQALLFELEQKRAAGTLSNAEQAIILKKIELTSQKSINEKKLEAFNLTQTDNRIRLAQDFFGKAKTDTERQFANQQIIDATSDIGKLTPAQVEVALKARLDQQAFAQQAFRENVENLKAQTLAQKGNTDALAGVKQELGGVQAALAKFISGALTIKIENEAVATVNVGKGFQD